MYLKELSLFQFKNHNESNFQFNEKINCFVGDNGAGKTNILDAIHYLSLTKSYFNHIDSNNIQFDHDFFMIKGIFNNNDTNDEILCNYQLNSGKILKKNQKRYKRFSDYLQNLINYNKVLKQRNSLLKQFSERNYFDPISLENYDNNLIKYGNEIHNLRKEFIEELTPVFNRYYKEISSNKENVSLDYKSQLNEKTFSILLKENLEKDKLSFYTSIGIHKDDIIFNMNNHSVKKIGSQGQQKSFLISLKLAQFDFITTKLGFKPILLLDDIFDKLDDNRVEQLISFTSKGSFSQVFITDTHEQRSKEILDKTGIDYEIFNIEN